MLPSDCPERQLVYSDFAEAYQWPPGVVDGLPLETLTWDPLIRRAKNEVRRIRQEQAERHYRR